MPIQANQLYAERSLRGTRSYSEQAFRGVAQLLFPPSYVLLPQIRQVYELDLAYGEYTRLTEDELVQRSAYFKAINGTPTFHFRICMNTPEQVNASARQDRRNFFAANVFAVGYATHGLFPYRGKFHPQMIKAVMNIMGLKPGHTVLDPMAGCGTTSIEASIMGINSIAYELSPFACLMGRAKLGALQTTGAGSSSLLQRADQVYLLLEKLNKQAAAQSPLFRSLPRGDRVVTLKDAGLPAPAPFHELLLLCYLDALGYAARRKRMTARQLFPQLLARYLAAVSAFDERRQELGLKLGTAQVIQGDARELQLPDASVDGVVFSPPYSFAIDYVDNDRPQLEYLGVDPEALKERMVGLTGKGKTVKDVIAARVANYFADMEAIMRHCERVLRAGRYCVIVIGSNTNQTGGVSLESRLVDIGIATGLPLEFQIMRHIEGIRNTMREEYLLFFRKPALREGEATS